MTYPKASTTGATQRPVEPALPGDRGAGARPTGSRTAPSRPASTQRDAGENGANEFVFYDGPPFANGLPHYGHLLTGYVKDVVPRYQTMRGRRVERRFGWDTHGLPAELEAMRLNGIKTTDEILELGIEKFNEACRASVMKYTGEWREYVTRQARWVDFDHDYRTMNPDYMESVIWAFKQLYDKGWVYEGFRVLPYCWNDETPLSNHELRMDDDVYQKRQDPAVTVGMRLTSGPAEGALAARLDDHAVDAAEQPRGDGRRGHRLRRGRVRRHRHDRALPAGRGPARGVRPRVRRRRRTILARFTGAELVGSTYTPPFSYYLGREQRVPAGGRREFVTTTDGTGLVHTAGAFGEDDKIVTDREGIEAVMPVGKDGRFTTPGRRLRRDAGLRREPADHRPPARRRPGRTASHRGGHAGHGAAAPRDLRPLLPALLALPRAADLQGRLVVVRRGDGVQAADARAQPADQLGARAHQGRPVRQVAGERPRLVDHPQPVLGLAGAGVAVRRPGVPADRRLRLVRGARARLRPAAAGPRRQPRPAPAVRRRPDPAEPRRPDRAKSTMRRVADVLDVWFDSGSMSFAQNHVPFENEDWFDAPLPGATSSSSTSTRPAAGSTRCTSWPPASSTGRRSRTASATASCSAPTATRCRSRCATTPTCARSSTATAPTRCAGS